MKRPRRRRRPRVSVSLVLKSACVLWLAMVAGQSVGLLRWSWWILLCPLAVPAAALIYVVGALIATAWFIACNHVIGWLDQRRRSRVRREMAARLSSAGGTRP